MISKEGLELIAKFEGFRSHPYHCSAGVSTIGFGTTHYEGGKHVTMQDKSISTARAYEILRYEVLHHYAAAVDRYVRADTNQNQRDALTSFAYNLGAGALKSSTLLRLHNEGKTNEAANEFQKWVHSNGKILKGLVERRQKERELYLKA